MGIFWGSEGGIVAKQSQRRQPWSTHRELVYEIEELLEIHSGVGLADDSRSWIWFWWLPKVATEVQKGSTVQQAFKCTMRAAIEATCPGKSGEAMRLLFDVDDTGRSLDERQEEARRLQASRIEYFTDYRRLVAREYIPRLAAWLCEGAPNSYNERLPDVLELEGALDDLCVKGLPLTRDRVTLTLTAFLPVESNTKTPTETAAVADRFVKWMLDSFEIDDLRPAAHILFAHAPGTKGTTLKRRYEAMAERSGRYGAEHARQKIRPQIVAALAWQMYRFKMAELAGENEGAPTDGGGSVMWRGWATGRTLTP